MTAAQWDIRPARPEDVPRLKQIGVTGWETTYSAFITPENRAAYLAGDFWSLETLRRVVADPGSLALVAESGGTIAAFITVEPRGDGEAGQIEITRLYVDPGTQRSGIGAALCRAAFDWARQAGARAVIVNVFADNAPGRAFYERLGFTLTSLAPTTVGTQTVGDAWYRLDL